MVVLNILQRQRDKLLGKQTPVDVDVKIPYDEESLKGGNAIGMFGYTLCTTYYLCLAAAMLLALIGTGGLYLYDEYKHAQSRHYQGWCDIPMDRDEGMPLPSEHFSNDIDGILDDVETFHQEFDILLEEQQAKIDVPDFRDGKRGRFLHDFSMNWTAIVDSDGKRCFIMPLNRTAVLPPSSLMDLISKMMDGYYDVNMNFIRQNMIVTLPPLRDMSAIGLHIKRECQDFPVYKLEKSTSPIVKRSAELPTKFIEYAGTNFQEFDIVNYDEIIKYEQEQRAKPT